MTFCKVQKGVKIWVLFTIWVIVTCVTEGFQLCRCVAIIPAFLWSQTEEKKFKAAFPIKEETDRYIS